MSWTIDNIGPDTLVFASGYRHAQSTADFSAKLKRSLGDDNQATIERFYQDKVRDVINLVQYFKRSLVLQAAGCAYSPSTALAMTLR